MAPPATAPRRCLCGTPSGCRPSPPRPPRVHPAGRPRRVFLLRDDALDAAAHPASAGRVTSARGTNSAGADGGDDGAGACAREGAGRPELPLAGVRGEAAARGARDEDGGAAGATRRAARGGRSATLGDATGGGGCGGGARAHARGTQGADRRAGRTRDDCPRWRRGKGESGGRPDRRALRRDILRRGGGGGGDASSPAKGEPRAARGGAPRVSPRHRVARGGVGGAVHGAPPRCSRRRRICTSAPRRFRDVCSAP